MTDEQKNKCHKIIHGASVAAAAAAASMSQLPSSDYAAIFPIQVSMVMALGAVFDQSITKSAATALLESAVGTTAGRIIVQWTVGWIPGIGNTINSVTAAGAVEMTGWYVADYFDTGHW